MSSEWWTSEDPEIRDGLGNGTNPKSDFRIFVDIFFPTKVKQNKDNGESVEFAIPKIKYDIKIHHDHQQWFCQELFLFVQKSTKKLTVVKKKLKKN